MADQTTILVPIRYPLTDHSSRTLAAAGRLASERAPATVRVLHVNLFQNSADVQTRELTRAISSVLDGVDASVIMRQGFLVEKIILEEATYSDADVIVVGTSQKATWRQLLSRVIGNDPAVSSFLHENTTDDVEIAEIDTAALAPAAD